MSKDPVLRYQVGTKKMKMSRYQVSLSTGGTEYPVNPVLDAYSYDFCEAENADGISKSSHENETYILIWTVTEFVKVSIN